MELAELGTRIARARELAGVSQTSLGDALGVDRSAISRMEKGDRKVSV
ncbi:MAG: helix-turn-helix domain-containing protein, partial [Pauljensenia sp.]